MDVCGIYLLVVFLNDCELTHGLLDESGHIFSSVFIAFLKVSNLVMNRGRNVLDRSSLILVGGLTHEEELGDRSVSKCRREGLDTRYPSLVSEVKTQSYDE